MDQISSDKLRFNKLPRKAEAYAEYTDGLKNWRKDQHKFSAYGKKFIKHQESVRKYRDILYKQIPKMYQVKTDLIQNLKKTNGDIDGFFKFVNFVKRRYRDVLKGAYDVVSDKSGALSDYHIRRIILLTFRKEYILQLRRVP